MENRYKWMEDSLKQTAELGLKVLERAKRREVDWTSMCTGEGRIRSRAQWKDSTQEEDEYVSLEDAFATVANFMHQTTEYCESSGPPDKPGFGDNTVDTAENYHNCLPVSRISQQEMKHVCKFHSRKPVQDVLKQGSTRSLSTGQLLHSTDHKILSKQISSEDVCIEVAPGTYSISAGSSNSHRQTKVVNITPGQSVDLTFHL